MIGLFLFLYITCEVGIWNWLPRHLIAQGVPESQALNILFVRIRPRPADRPRCYLCQFSCRVPAITVTLIGSVAMAATTFLMLRTSRPAIAFVLVFLAGLSMAPSSRLHRYRR